MLSKCRSPSFPRTCNKRTDAHNPRCKAKASARTKKHACQNIKTNRPFFPFSGREICRYPRGDHGSALSASRRQRKGNEQGRRRGGETRREAEIAEVFPHLLPYPATWTTGTSESALSRGNFTHQSAEKKDGQVRLGHFGFNLALGNIALRCRCVSIPIRVTSSLSRKGW